MNRIYYKSTRGNEKVVEASEAILQGIAEDGGLFVPCKIPKVELDLNKLSKMDYKEVAYFVMSKFFTDFTEVELKECIDKAYDSKFDTEEIAPLTKVNDEFFLELYHGPTLAFKDMALSILPYLMITSAKKQNLNKDVVILTATSGDTGKAALEGFTNIDGVKIIVFFPQEGVSQVQKYQMITHEGNNTYVVAIKGNFDDAQSGVKEIFADKEFKDLLEKNNYIFSSANSINIGRLIPQIVYYFYAYISLYKNNEIKEKENINVVVPTGNFGNILAAYYAKQMGLPINKFLCASNDNKVLHDFMETGVYDKNRKFLTTISPSMDILISSNLERLLYSLSKENTLKVNNLMERLNCEGKYRIDENMRNSLEDFYGNYASEEETKEAIKEVYKKSNYLIDTHTAVAYVVNKKYKDKYEDSTKTIIASTASPYKFTNAVMNSIQKNCIGLDEFVLLEEMSKLLNEDVPKNIKDLNKRKVIHTTICEKSEMSNCIKKFLNIK
ncbi:threonine synthase [Clostridium sp. MB40-C1]|uniref:threonine synthase n=1 Tax=Clostridium sp. MB40-C1 TaxID=3070996 RepID=UPI0027E058B3|nr:threonine synthase [Clostridium sp. MB40-C1]WMJ80102.1 threonine synthase [Clostridium sp. MB40-C1]